MSNSNNIQTPEEMLARWQSAECTCDFSVGHMCEMCHDTQIILDLLKKYEKAIKALEFIVGFDDIDDLVRDIAIQALNKPQRNEQ